METSLADAVELPGQVNSIAPNDPVTSRPVRNIKLTAKAAEMNLSLVRKSARQPAPKILFEFPDGQIKKRHKDDHLRPTHSSPALLWHKVPPPLPVKRKRAPWGSKSGIRFREVQKKLKARDTVKYLAHGPRIVHMCFVCKHLRTKEELERCGTGECTSYVCNGCKGLVNAAGNGDAYICFKCVQYAKPCRVCNKPVMGRPPVKCAQCGGTAHRDCSGLEMSSGNREWRCPDCDAKFVKKVVQFVNKAETVAVAACSSMGQKEKNGLAAHTRSAVATKELHDFRRRVESWTTESCSVYFDKANPQFGKLVTEHHLCGVSLHFITLEQCVGLFGLPLGLALKLHARIVEWRDKMLSRP